MRASIPIMLLVALLFPLRTSGNDSREALQDAWQDSVLLLYNDAYRAFVQGVKSNATHPREWHFGQAVNLLNLQPRTDANVTRAQKILLALVDEQATDEIGILSRYYLGRVAQVHRLTPDPEQALQIYRDLLDDHPGDLFAQYAGVKWAITYLGTAPTAESRYERMVEIEPLVDRLTHSGPAKDLHLFMADALMRYGGPNEDALRHLIAATDLGIEKRNVRGDTFVRIGELARLMNQDEVALDYYGRFLAEFPLDLRTYTISRTVAEMERAP